MEPHFIEAQQKKAKEEERQRIVGILEEVRNNFWSEPSDKKILDFSLERINNQ